MPYIFDYDDYDVPLSNFFARGRYNRLFFGSNRYDEITYRLARKALCCIASSHFLVDFLRACNPNVHLVETGVDTTLFHPPENDSLRDRFRYFWNGIIWGEPIWKNVEFVLEAFRRVHEKHPEPELLFAVGGLLLDRFKEFVRKEYGDLPVRILDWVPPSAMPMILRSVRVGLLPLVQKEEWFQAKSPTKLYEYMASGLAVVASPTGEANYIIRDGVDGIFADSLEGFAAAMIRLYEEPTLCERMSRSAAERAQNRYSLDALGDTLNSAIGGFLRPE
jgi:glycosyltransferase involved in cell wall biosynthesis